MSMSITKGSGKAIKAASGLTFAAVAAISTVGTSSVKYAPGAPLLQQTRIFLSRMFGPQLALALTGQNPASVGTSGLPPQGITPFGVFNPTLAGGVILLIADHIIKSFIGGKMHYNSVSPFIKAVGGGLTLGGLVGGLFDPDPSTGTAQGGGSFLALTVPSQASAISGSTLPYRSVTAVRLHGR